LASTVSVPQRDCRQEVAIHLADQDLHPDMDVQVVLEKQPNPKNISDVNKKFFVRAEDSQRRVLHEETVELESLHPVDFKFHAAEPGIYTVNVSDSLKVPAASRSIEIRNLNLEFMDTARNMEMLRQWASVSDGLALKAEDCDAGELVRSITSKIEQTRRNRRLHNPVGSIPGCWGWWWALWEQSGCCARNGIWYDFPKFLRLKSDPRSDGRILPPERGHSCPQQHWGVGALADG